MRSRLVVLILLAMTLVNLTGSGSVAGAEPTLRWTFNSSLSGWSSGRAGAPGSSDWGKVSIEHQGSNGYARLDGNGDPPHPNAWIFRTIDLPVTATTLRYAMSADDVPGSDAGFEVRLVAGGKTTVLAKGDARNLVPNRLSFRTTSINIKQWAGQTVTLFFMQNDNGVNGVIHVPDEDEQLYYDNIEIVAPIPSCDVSGTVRDGNLASDGHDNPLVGVPVEVLRNGTPVAAPVITGADGQYCLPGGAVEPGEYTLRASLVDGEHTPSIFQTRHEGSSEPVSVSQDITQADFGRHDLDLTFSTSAGQPWLADVANIHWQSGRFVDWLLDRLVLDPVALAGLVIDTGTTTGTAYTPGTKTVHIQASDTPYSKRQDGTTECPENCEWHEISHHVAAIEGIAPTATAAACVGRVNHGGWSNDSTCDSLSEGFGMFLPTLASLDIDAGRGANYATPAYSVFGSMEDNGYRPESLESGDYREDLAVTQLLWDLADDTSSEATSLLWEPHSNMFPLSFQGLDRVSIGGVKVVQLLILAKPTTVADVYDRLVADPAVPAVLKQADLDINGDGTPDLSPLAEVFVAHGFHARQARSFGAYIPADGIGVTQPGSHNLTVRRDEPQIPGSGIRFVNGSAAAATVSIDVTYPSTSSHIEVTVAPNTSRVLHLEVPPYWAGEASADGSLPPCTPDDPWPVAITLAAVGTASATLSSCQYLHFVAETSTDFAVTYDIGSGLVTPAPPTAAPATSAPAASPPAPASSATTDGATADSQIVEFGPLLVAVLLVAAVLALSIFRSRRRMR